MESKKSLPWALLALVLAGLIVFLFVPRSKEESDVGNKAQATKPDELRQDNIGSTPEKTRSDQGVRAHKRSKPRLPKNAIDRKKRAEVLALILSALQAKERKKEEKHPRESSKPSGLPAEYIREAVREIIPLLKECYHMELEERGDISGKVVLGFDLVADDEHGGLVEEASILESELSKEISDSFAECLRESVYALRLDAPKWGGRHTVRYPLFFSAIGHDD